MTVRHVFSALSNTSSISPVQTPPPYDTYYAWRSSSVPAQTCITFFNRWNKKIMRTTALIPPNHRSFVHTDTHAHEPKCMRQQNMLRAATLYPGIYDIHTHKHKDGPTRSGWPTSIWLCLLCSEVFENGQNTWSLWPSHLWHFNCPTHQNTHSDRVKLWCHSSARFASHVSVPYAQLDTIFDHDGDVNSGMLCVFLNYLPRPREIPPHLGCLAISQWGSVEFLHNNHASPVFSKHCVGQSVCDPFSGKQQAVSVDCITLLHLTNECKQTEQWDSQIIRPSQAWACLLAFLGGTVFWSIMLSFLKSICSGFVQHIWFYGGSILQGDLLKSPTESCCPCFFIYYQLLNPAILTYIFFNLFQANIIW